MFNNWFANFLKLLCQSLEAGTRWLPLTISTGLDFPGPACLPPYTHLSFLKLLVAFGIMMLIRTIIDFKYIYILNLYSMLGIIISTWHELHHLTYQGSIKINFLLTDEAGCCSQNEFKIDILPIWILNRDLYLLHTILRFHTPESLGFWAFPMAPSLGRGCMLTLRAPRRGSQENLALLSNVTSWEAFTDHSGYSGTPRSPGILEPSVLFSKEPSTSWYTWCFTDLFMAYFSHLVLSFKRAEISPFPPPFLPFFSFLSFSLFLSPYL